MASNEASALVTAALRAVDDGSTRPEPDKRQLPEVQAILDAPDELRRACVLDLVQRRDSNAHRHVELLSVIARKRLELSATDIEILSRPYAEPGPPGTRAWQCRESVRILSRQVESAYSGLSDTEKARIKPFLEHVAGVVGDTPLGASTANRLRKLIAAGGQIPYELIDLRDDVGLRMCAVFETSRESDEARAAALVLVGTYPETGRPSKKWHAEAERVCNLLARPALLMSSLIDAALEATDTEQTHTDFTLTRFTDGGNESFLCGAATFAGIVGDASVLPRLGRLAAKSVAIIGSGYYRHTRSVRLANASVEAIANVGAPSSITELRALEGSARHGTLLKQIRKAIDALAEAQQS